LFVQVAGIVFLAIDLEGTEVCEWLTRWAYAILLKDRVPKREGLEDILLPCRTRSARWTRARERKEWGIHPKRIGVEGISSAGGHLLPRSAIIITNALIPKVDDAARGELPAGFHAADLSCVFNPERSRMTNLAPEINITSNTPPTFIAMTQDDRCGWRRDVSTP